ncbi:hypothetical protein JJV70_20090 [Streptomyces sp. JJ66]|uniref:hypothetical protein n=1 Tax=Streptomyces sp. JJ66 TaxID=2803843 RepID=UPI001C566A53|nr:hypothetical protein [Streptomyces sp. JJ66]MBW1604362.1 hypothetical protein [Streptomyces sp. JJ66]
MASHARHARPRTPQLVRAGLTLSAAAAAALGATGSAQADVLSPDALSPESLSAATDGVGTALGHTVAPLTDLRLNPLGGTGTDPLDNSVGTQVADFQTVSTAPLTEPLSEGGASVDSLVTPVISLLGP